MFCFAMTSQYYESELFMFPIADVDFPVFNHTNYFLIQYDLTRYGFVRINIISIATCAYTWLILPIILICYLFEKQPLDKGLLASAYFSTVIVKLTVL